MPRPKKKPIKCICGEQPYITTGVYSVICECGRQSSYRSRARDTVAEWEEMVLAVLHIRKCKAVYKKSLESKRGCKTLHRVHF